MKTPETTARSFDEFIPDTAYAKAARYDAAERKIVVTLHHDIELCLPTRLLQGVADAPPAAITNIQISPEGTGLYWPDLDVDLYLPSLLLGITGSPQWMARRLGQSGGRSQSAAKARAARENGRKGGRPRKRPDET